MQFDEVDADDEDAVEGVFGVVVGGEDPVVVPLETVLTADHHIIRPYHRISAPNDDVVVLDEL